MKSRASQTTRSPFALDDPDSYGTWRAGKLAERGRPEPIDIADAGDLRGAERDALLETCRARNFAVFRVHSQPDDVERALRPSP